MVSRATWGWALTIAAVGICAGVAIWRVGIGKPAPLTWQSAVRAGRAAYAPIATERISNLASLESVRSVLEPMPFHVEQDAPPGARERLLDEAAQFVYYRFCQPSAQAYMAWRRAEGYSLKPMAALLRPGLIDSDYPLYFHEPFPSDASVEELFPKFWSIGLSQGDGTNRPVAIATESKGLAATVGVIRRSNLRDRPGLAGEMAADLWNGANGMTMRSWWNPLRSLDALLTISSEVPCAEVGMILEYGDGTRRPLRLTYVYDSGTHTWNLQYVVMYNFDRAVATYSSLEY